jgi:hypothetical protein
MMCAFSCLGGINRISNFDITEQYSVRSCSSIQDSSRALGWVEPFWHLSDFSTAMAYPQMHNTKLVIFEMSVRNKPYPHLNRMGPE